MMTSQSTDNIEPQHIARYRFEFAMKPNQVWHRLKPREYRWHRRARRRAAKYELRKQMEVLDAR